MQEQNERRFRVRLGPPRARGAPHGQRFLSRVLAAISRAGGGHRAGLATSARGHGAKRGRGVVAARLSGATLGSRSRRVVIKARLVILKRASPHGVLTHLRYIVREGVGRDAEPAQAYDARTDSADVKVFEAQGRDDRHQFRFIVAPEYGVQLTDLRGFTRELMRHMEGDLGTRLDWVAVDHWDTDNPHTHVVLRGKDEKGRDLIIARDYISHGMRHRASELATEWLGPRTDWEDRAGMQAEIEQQRWTGLDRALQAQCSEGVVDLRGDSGAAKYSLRRSLLIGRLQRLSAMGLAEPQGPGRWRLRPDTEATLRAMGERGDIVRTMQRALAGKQRELAIFEPSKATRSIVGRVAAKGFADELNERAYVVVDGVDGRAHYVRLPAGADLAEIPMGGIIEARGATERPADRNIAALAEDGLYRTDRHLIRLRAEPPSGRDPEEVVAAHVRRLEALRRAGIAERLSEGVWRIPTDLVARGRAYDHQHLRAAPVELQSHLPIEKQIRAIGATWLDRQLIEGASNLSNLGFAATVRHALKARAQFLVEQGLAERRGQRVIPARDLLATLRSREIETAAKRIAKETGLMHRALRDGTPPSGVYRRSVLLASGRFAMLDDGLGFSLVPWRPVIAKRLGQAMSAVVRGGHVVWAFGRQRDRSP